MEGCYVENTELLDICLRLSKYTWVNSCLVGQVCHLITVIHCIGIDTALHDFAT